MDFFASQDDARRRTSLLLVYYALAVCGIIAGVYLVLAALLAYSEAAEGPGRTAAFSSGWLWHPGLLLVVTVATLGIIGLGTLFKTMQLKQGGAKVAALLGGRRVPADTADPLERRFRNVVEEMAIASGIAVPDVYVLDQEPGINAFAAGFSPADAVIGVTAGTLKTLNRDELQGVIAHEFSHIVHGDMRLNIKLMGVLHGILLIALLGYVLLRSAAFSNTGRRSRNNKGNAAIALVVLGLAVMVIGYIGVFFANLIKSAVSRQREFLADAAAVQFTRNPGGIAGALKRIAGFSQGARVRDVHAAEASHLFFGNALRAPLLGMLATHPPLPERIRRLDPAFNPEITRLASPASAATADAAGISSLSGAVLSAEAIAAGTGNPTGAHLEAAQRLIARLPDKLARAARQPDPARALVYALLLQADTTVRERQLDILRADNLSDPAAVVDMADSLAALRPLDRLTLAELAAPALREMPRQAYQIFSDTLTRVMQADNRISLFEYALHRLLLRHVAPAFLKADAAAIRHRDFPSIRAAATDVMLALAAWGSEATQESRAAFAAGMARLSPEPIPYPNHTPSLDRIDEALTRLAQASPPLKKNLIEACAACVTADGRIGPDQGELLRAIADALDCPMPPLQLEAA